MRYITLGYKDRIVEPKYWEAPQSVFDYLESLAESVAESVGSLGRPTTVVGTAVPRLCSAGTGISRRNIFERVRFDDDRVAFRTLEENTNYGTHEYVQADPGSGALWVLPMHGPGDWETFREIELGDDHIALETWHKTFVTAEGDGDGSPLAIDRDEIGEWQRFMYLVPPQELLPEAEPDPPIAHRATGGVEHAQTHVSGTHANPVGGVQGAQTHVERPKGLLGKILRPFGR
jgi:hypothetical protein